MTTALRARNAITLKKRLPDRSVELSERENRLARLDRDIARRNRETLDAARREFEELDDSERVRIGLDNRKRLRDALDAVERGHGLDALAPKEKPLFGLLSGWVLLGDAGFAKLLAHGGPMAMRDSHVVVRKHWNRTASRWDVDARVDGQRLLKPRPMNELLSESRWRTAWRGAPKRVLELLERHLDDERLRLLEEERQRQPFV